MDLPVMPPVKPMLAKVGTGIPPGRLYEPKWDGFRSVVFRDGDEVESGSRNERPMTRYFPEIVDAVRANLPERCVVDGEIVLVDPERGALDFEALQLRLHPAASRVRLLAEQTPASFVVFDVLAVGDDDLTSRPFAERRHRLEDLLAGAEPPVHLTPITDDEALAERWFEDLEGAGLDGLIAKSPDLLYQQDKRVMTKVKHVRTADCVVAGYRLHTTSRDAVGSLMLGVYGDDGKLASIGVIGAFPMARRRALLTELQPYVTDFDGHPWNWAEYVTEMTPAQRRGFGSRWNAGKDLSFVPLRPELVVEAKYDYLEGGRFRHTAQFVRWRPDREPRSCTWEQFDRPVTYDLADLFGPTG
ncbi:MAG TPA: ATP-dependent DNA ligase [Lapillicoccus sp.]|nr:ATP-dependent DNA ligase [Lapillicoccus sp.]